MEGLLNICQRVSNNDRNLQIFAPAYDEHQSFRLKGLHASDAVIQHITSLVNRPSTRNQGFYLLTSVFPQFPLEVIDQKGALWSQLAIKTCTQKGLDKEVALAFQTLRLLLVKSIHIPELSKAFSGNLIAKIGETLSDVSALGHLEALKCVETCLRLYPGPCGTVRGYIETFTLRFVDSTDENLVIWSGKCLHLLQQVRGGGVQGINYKTAWQFYETKLIGSLHKTLDSIFANCSEFYDENIEKAQLKLPPMELSNEPIERATQLAIRFRNLLTYLVIALREPFPVSKAVMPKKILNLITRGLGVNCEMLSKKLISDNLAIGALLPGLHVELFKLVDALILTMKSHLAQYFKTILGFVYDTLKWTSSKKSTGHQKPFINLRSAAYNTLSLWCTTMKFGSCVEVISEGIIEQIDYDITPFQNEFTLKVLSGAKKHMSKKARRQLHKAQNEQSNLAQTHSKSGDSQNLKYAFSDEGNQTLCWTALKCLKSVLVASSCFLKPTVIKDVHSKIVTLCLQLSEHRSLKEKLYSNHLCRLGLYEVLETLVLAPNNLCPPPTQVALKLLSTAQTNDCHSAVRETCFNFMKNLEKVIHPQKECLLFPPELREIKQAFSKYGRSLTTDENGAESSSDDEEEEDSENEEVEETLMSTSNGDSLPPPENIADPTDGEETPNVDILDAPVRNGKSEEMETIDLTANREINIDSSIICLDENSQPEGEQRVAAVRPEVIECPESPEIVLHLDDESDEDAAQIDLVEDEDKDEPPAAKKQKVANVQEEAIEGNEEALLEEIVATFVDELNDE